MSAVVLSGGRVLNIGGAAFSIAPPAPTPSGPSSYIKFNPGHWMGTENAVQGCPVSQAQTEINLLATGNTNVQGYWYAVSWSMLENFALTTNTNTNTVAGIDTQYPGFANFLETVANYLLIHVPTARFGFWLTLDKESGSGAFTTAYIQQNFSTAGAPPLPQWMLQPSTLTVPDFFGASTTSLYSGPVGPIFSGASAHGFMFSQLNAALTAYTVATLHWHNPAIVQGVAQMIQAMGKYVIKGLGAGTAPFTGMTFNECPWFEGFIFNDEVSWNFTQNISGGSVVNPPQTTGGAPIASNTAIKNGYKQLMTLSRAAFPSSSVGICYSFGVTTDSGTDSNTNIAADINANLSGGIGLSNIGGLAMGSSDWFCNEYNLNSWTNGQANPAFQGMLGIVNPVTPVVASPLAPNVNSILGKMRWNKQMQPVDYKSSFASGVSGYSTALLTGIVQGAIYDQSTHVIWGVGDDPNFGTNAWTGAIGWTGGGVYVFLQTSAALGLSVLLPFNDMAAPENLAVVSTGTTTATVTWTGDTNAANTSHGWLILNNGTAVGTVTTASVGTFNLTGFTVSDTVTVRMTNANGLGPPASATISGWQTLPVGGGGYVRGLIMAADGTMVGRTDTAGAYLYNRTTASWNQLINPTSMPASWINANFILALGGCYELAIAPSNTQIFYMNFINTLWKSTNQGTTWTQLTGFGTHVCNPNDNNSQFGQKMAIDPNNPNIVYAGTESSGLFVTSNGGTTWTTVSGVPAGTGAGICGIVFGPASNVISGVTQVIYVCRQGTGVYVSTNGGTSWTLTSAGPTTVQNAQLDASGNYWCSGNLANVWKYNGTTWTNSTTGGGNGMQAVAVNPFNNSEIVGVDQSGHITFSANGGSTWTGINQNEALVSTDIPWLGPTSTTGGTGNNFYLSAGNAAFSPLTNGLLYLSSGVGVWSMNVPPAMTGSTAITWNDLSVGIENLVANEIIVPPGQGPVIASWDRAVFFLSPPAYPTYYLPVTDGGINAAWSIDYASSDATFICGIVETSLSGFSHNNGVSWTNFAAFPTGSGEGGCIASSTPSNIVMGVSTPNAPSYTLNGGTSWTQIAISGITSWTGFLPGRPSGCWRKICADRVNANTFYLYASGLAAGNGVYMSTNGGATWTQQHAGYIETNTSYANQLVPQIKAVPGNAGNLFYCSGSIDTGTQTSPATDAFFFRSTNSGATWTQVANVLQVNSFGFGAPKPGGGGYPAVFINGFVGGVFGMWRSDDNCVTWNNIGTWPGPNGLSSVISMAGDMNNYGYCYVGLGGFGAGGTGAGCSYAYYIP